MESERKRGGAGRLHLSAVSAEGEARVSHVVPTDLDHVTKSTALQPRRAQEFAQLPGELGTSRIFYLITLISAAGYRAAGPAWAPNDPSKQ